MIQRPIPPQVPHLACLGEYRTTDATGKGEPAVAAAFAWVIGSRMQSASPQVFSQVDVDIEWGIACNQEAARSIEWGIACNQEAARSIKWGIACNQEAARFQHILS